MKKNKKIVDSDGADAAGRRPVIRTIYAEYRIKTRYSAFFVPFLHKECISTIAYGAFLGLIWD